MISGLLRGFLRMPEFPRQGRGPRTSKRGPVGFYKGKGCRSLGKFYGGKGVYRTDPAKIPEIVVPDMSGFELKPYVAIKRAAPSAESS
mmetsp:Transcript_20021/g.34419  ORF Transcript_20021/g.34419 Transcript_20021/m.34419 type:complete len:88 (+) Transcript_20021:140-403(+)